MDAGKLLTEIALVSQFLNRQQGLGCSIADQLTAQATSIAQKMRLLTSLDYSQAIEISDLLSNGPWTQKQKADLGVGTYIEVGK